MNTGSAGCKAVICGIALCGLLGSPLRADVRSPWVTTDRTVDCSSYETILAGALRPGMTDEQKAIALYDFYRQRVYHYRNMPESRNPLKCINVLGNTLCGSQATCMKGLLTAAGIRTRVVSHPGHTFYEAFYGGKWHGFDTMCHFYVFTRGKGRNVASFAELNADPSLIAEAVKEHRACAGMCPCGDKPMAFAQKVRVLNYQPQKSDWSVKDYRLRAGEEIVRSWWPHDEPLPGTHRGRDPGPLHTCGSRDRRNPPELFRFWEPYGIPRFGGVSVSYRHYFNGWMSYSPDLSQPPWKEALAGGEVVVPVKCPFYISGATVAFEATCPGAGDRIAVSVRVGSTWQEVMTAGGEPRREVRASLSKFVVRPSRGRHEYWLRFSIEGKAVLRRFHLRTAFVHNATAAPHLMPGRNRVTVTADRDAGARAEGLTLVYRYAAAPGWTERKVIEKTATSFPFTFAVDLPETKKLPQMRDLTLRCGALHWVPKVQRLPDRVLCDFSKPRSVKPWRADPDIALSHDGVGMVLAVSKKATYPQASLTGPKADWRGFKSVVIELENLRDAPQEVVFRVRSNELNAQRTDVQQTVGKGRSVLRIPIAGLRKTRIDAVTKIYLMIYGVPEAGCRIRVTRITLEPPGGSAGPTAGGRR